MPRSDKLIGLRAVVMAVSVELVCPECYENIPEPRTGSFVWEEANFGDGVSTKAECPTCHVALIIPSRNGAGFRK